MALPRLRAYHLLALLPWPRSYAGRLLALVFVGLHVPLALALVFAAVAGHFDNGGVRDVLLAVFVGSLAGLLITLPLLYAALAPIRLTAEALAAFNERRQRLHLPSTYTDEAGQLMGLTQRSLEGLETALHDLEWMATSDPLTGVGNRRWLMSQAASELERSRRSGEPTSVILFDIDRFKSINDRFGHSAGDLVLRTVAELAISELRPYDVVARIGGEEFCIVLPNTALPAAAAIAERLRSRIAGFAYEGMPPAAVSASFGVTAVGPSDAGFAAVMRRADDQLFAAKHLGRNRVSVVEAPAVPSRDGG